MAYLFGLIKLLLLIALTLGLLTLAVPMFLLGAYLKFLWDCFLLGCEAYTEAKKYVFHK